MDALGGRKLFMPIASLEPLDMLVALSHLFP
jgi:hypothetical protein